MSYCEAGSKEEKCENCQLYRFIDSGYGHCRRYPPKTEERFVRSGIVLRKEYNIEYPVVPWDHVTCGEFKKRRKYESKSKGR